MGFSLVLHGTVPKDELMGTVVGHVWYFFEDVYPPLHEGRRPFEPPSWWRRIFEGRPAAVDAEGDTGEDVHGDLAVAAAPEVR